MQWCTWKFYVSCKAVYQWRLPVLICTLIVSPQTWVNALLMKIWTAKSVRKCCYKTNTGWDHNFRGTKCGHEIDETNGTLHLIDFVVSSYSPAQNIEKLKGVDIGKHPCKSNSSIWWLICYSKCGLWSSSLAITWKFVKNMDSQIHPDVLNQNLQNTAPWK